MRAVWATLILSGCGAVHLGDERAGSGSDGGTDAAADSDAATLAGDDAGSLRASLSVRADLACDAGCYGLSASASGGQAPYSFEWEDGSHEAERRVCTTPSAISVTVSDADGARDRAELSLLDGSDAGCPAPTPLLCLENPSFEGKPEPNLGLPNVFDAAPWSACTEPGASNTPEVVNDTIEQLIAAIPKPTHGETFLGMTEDERASQKLCRVVSAGSTLSLALDLSRLYLGAGVVPDTERPFLEIWGGVAADCSSRELLWASPPLEMGWKRYCVTLRPSQFMDLISLHARSDGVSATLVSYLLVDNLEPVRECP